MEGGGRFVGVGREGIRPLTLFAVELAQNLPYDLAHTLECFQVVLSLVVSFFRLLHLLPEVPNLDTRSEQRRGKRSKRRKVSPRASWCRPIPQEHASRVTGRRQPTGLSGSKARPITCFLCPLSRPLVLRLPARRPPCAPGASFCTRRAPARALGPLPWFSPEASRRPSLSRTLTLSPRSALRLAVRARSFPTPTSLKEQKGLKSETVRPVPISTGHLSRRKNRLGATFPTFPRRELWSFGALELWSFGASSFLLRLKNFFPLSSPGLWKNGKPEPGAQSSHGVLAPAPPAPRCGCKTGWSKKASWPQGLPRAGYSSSFSFLRLWAKPWVSRAPLDTP